MGQPSYPIKSILTAGTSRGTVALVVLDNGDFAITRNGELLHDHYWPATQLDQCIDMFMNLTKDPAASS